jgi:hypothetical protein
MAGGLSTCLVGSGLTLRTVSDCSALRHPPTGNDVRSPETLAYSRNISDKAIWVKIDKIWEVADLT